MVPLRAGGTNEAEQPGRGVRNVPVPEGSCTLEQRGLANPSTDRPRWTAGTAWQVASARSSTKDRVSRQEAEPDPPPKDPPPKEDAPSMLCSCTKQTAPNDQFVAAGARRISHTRASTYCPAGARLASRRRAQIIRSVSAPERRAAVRLGTRDFTWRGRAVGARARGAGTRPAGCGRRRCGVRSSRGRRPGSRRRCVLLPWRP